MVPGTVFFQTGQIRNSRATAFTRSTLRISALLSCCFLLGWYIELRCSATEPTSGVGREKKYDNSGDNNPQAPVL